MNTYTYSISAVFSNNVDISGLQLEINENESISDCLYIDTVDDNIYLYFPLMLSDAEITILESIMAAHVPPPPSLTLLSAVVIPTNLDRTNNTTYTKFCTYTYLGTIRESPLKSIYVVGHMDSGVTDYSIRILDITNNLVIVEQTFTNTAESSLDLGVLSNIPVNQAILEMQIRKSGGNNSKRVYVNSLALYV